MRDKEIEWQLPATKMIAVNAVVKNSKDSKADFIFDLMTLRLKCKAASCIFWMAEQDSSPAAQVINARNKKQAITPCTVMLHHLRREF